MGGIIQKFRNWWESSDKNQRLITIGGAAFLVLLLAGVFVFASKPKMQIMFSSLSPEDTGKVVQEIQLLGMPVEYDSVGNVSVPAEKMPEIRGILGAKGSLPKSSSHLTKKDLNNMPVMAPPRVESERLLAITEGQLAESIEVFTGVESAQVHVSRGNDSPLLDRAKQASASVTITEKVGESVNPDQGRAMAMMVASSVDGLSADKVSIFSNDGRSIWDGQENSGTSGRAVNKLEMEKQYARSVRDDLQEQLNRIVGNGNALATVEVTLDLDKINQTEDNTLPTEDPLVKESVSETMGNGANPGSNGGGAAGLNSNGGTTTPGTGAGPTGDGKYVSKQERTEKGFSTTHKSIEKAPGDIKSMAITVLVNNEKVTDPKDIAKIQDLANARLGTRIADPANFAASVIDYKFDNTAQIAAAKATETANSSAQKQQIISMLPILALVAVAFLVMRTLGKMGKTAGVQLGGQQLAFAGAGGPMLPGGHQSIASMAAHSLSIPEAAVQKALESGLVDDELAAALAEAQSHAGPDGEDVNIPSIGNKINVPLEQIKKMSNEKPEVVAMLIKSWLLEEGIRR